MKTPILAALLLIAAPAFATPESDRIAALEARLAALESVLPKSAPVAAPAPRPSRAAVLAAGQIASWQHPFFAAIGAPIFGYPGYGGGGSGASSFAGLTGAITSAQMIDPYVPVDGTMNVTGALAVSTTIQSSGNVTIGTSTNAYLQIGASTYPYIQEPTTTGDLLFAVSATEEMKISNSARSYVTPKATFGFDLNTTGSKVTCDSTNAGSLFYENTASDATVAKLFLCGEKADNSYAWGEVTVTFP